MRKISFIGSYDKIDLILYIAKILVATDKKVLVIDSTINQKAKYIVPVIKPTKAYVTDFEDIDVAVGFSNFNEIKEYLGMPIHAELPYDIALIDIDSYESIINFGIDNSDKNYFVTGFDLYTLKRGLEILSGITEILNLTKVCFSKTATKEDANDAVKAIRKKIAEIYGQNVADGVIIQYGGSVKSSNAKELFSMSDIDGALVGGASLKADEFSKIVEFEK